jgi:hypothetical protein
MPFSFFSPHYPDLLDNVEASRATWRCHIGRARIKLEASEKQLLPYPYGPWKKKCKMYIELKAVWAETRVCPLWDYAKKGIGERQKNKEYFSWIRKAVDGDFFWVATSGGLPPDEFVMGIFVGRITQNRGIIPQWYKYHQNNL